MAWKDDARLSVNMYGDADNFILLSINQAEGQHIGDQFAQSAGIDVPHATPELVGEAFAKYLRKYFWTDEGEKKNE